MSSSPLHQTSLGHINRLLYIYLVLTVVIMAFSIPELDATGVSDWGRLQLHVYTLPTMGTLLLCSFLMTQQKDNRREDPATIFYSWFVPLLLAAAALYELMFIVLHLNDSPLEEWSWLVVHGLMTMACLHLFISTVTFGLEQKKLRQELKEIAKMGLREEVPLTRSTHRREVFGSQEKEPQEETAPTVEEKREETPVAMTREGVPGRKSHRFLRLCRLLGTDTEGALRTRLEEGCAEMLRRSQWGSFAGRGSDEPDGKPSGLEEADIRLMAQALAGYILREKAAPPILSRPCHMIGRVFDVKVFLSLLSENLAEEITNLYIRRDSSLYNAALTSLLLRYRWCANADKFFDFELLSRLIQHCGEEEERDAYRRAFLEALQELRAR